MQLIAHTYANRQTRNLEARPPSVSVHWCYRAAACTNGDRYTHRQSRVVVSMKTKLLPNECSSASLCSPPTRYNAAGRCQPARVPSCMEAMGLLDLVRGKWASDALCAVVCRNRVYWPHCKMSMYVLLHHHLIFITQSPCCRVA